MKVRNSCSIGIRPNAANLLHVRNTLSNLMTDSVALRTSYMGGLLHTKINPTPTLAINPATIRLMHLYKSCASHSLIYHTLLILPCPARSLTRCQQGNTHLKLHSAPANLQHSCLAASMAAYWQIFAQTSGHDFTTSHWDHSALSHSSGSGSRSTCRTWMACVDAERQMGCRPLCTMATCCPPARKPLIFSSWIALPPITAAP